MTENSLGDAFLLQDKLFVQKLDLISQTVRRNTQEERIRYWIALLLKATALIGGIVVAAVHMKTVSIAVGILISLSVALDQLTSNANLLIALTDANIDLDRLHRKIATEHSAALPDIIDEKNKGDPDVAKERLRKLIAKLSSEIDAEMQRINGKLAAARRNSRRALVPHRR